MKYEFGERREGDVPKLVANSDKANEELGWKTTKKLDEMCEDSYRFTVMRLKSE